MGIQDLFADGKKPNLVFIITDQERSLQHWPDDFARENLPAMMRLMNNGLTFTQAFTNACCCSPSRATLLTSRYPTQHGVTYTGSPEPKYSLPKDLTNLATVLRKAGYNKCEWRGKWHLGGGGPEEYGFNGWVPPDAGNYLSLNDTLGGGTPDNDGRFLNEIIEFLDNQKGKENEPFCLVASFVNPHDVYVAQYDADATFGYTTDDFNRISVPIPSNKNEDLERNNKPRAQVMMSWPYVPFQNSQQDYVNFYAYLHTIVDGQIMQVLDRLDHNGLTDDTLIVRFADHGEQALSHSLVEKFLNTYEESIHIPLIFSNPIAYPEPQSTNALASLLDLIPTVAHLLGVADDFPASFHGKDLTLVLRNSNEAVQRLIHFTYDDIPCHDAPSIIRCIRTLRYKYTVYFTSKGDDADWELYDLEDDPNEDDNKAGRETYATVQSDLEDKLLQSMKCMKTLPSAFQWPPKETRNSRGSKWTQEVTSKYM